MGFAGVGHGSRRGCHMLVVIGLLGIPLVEEERCTCAVCNTGGFSTATGFGVGTLNYHSAVRTQRLPRFMCDALRYDLAIDCRGSAILTGAFERSNDCRYRGGCDKCRGLVGEQRSCLPLTEVIEVTEYTA